ncbi:MAG: hypothetical protein RJA22_2456 [Verrucomicrobiota bacterium]|jgi:hypothetical protein
MNSRALHELAERKRLLVAEAELHRSLIQAEVTRCHARLETAREGMRVGGPWLAAGSALGGILLARKWRNLTSVLPTALPSLLAAWRWYKKFREQ